MSVQIILKNSSVEDKRPSANQLANGEVSLNYNEAGAFLCCRDTEGNIQQIGGIKISGDAPASPVRGTLWLQPASSTLFVYSGTAWISIAGGGGDSGGGGGGGAIDQIIGGEGVDVSPSSGVGVVTVNAAVDTARGVAITGSKIATNIGLGLSFGTGGVIDANVASVNGGDGIIATTDASNEITVEANIDTNKGLEFSGDAIAVNLGVGLAFNASTGAIDSQAQAMVYRGVVDLTSDGNVPGSPTVGDTYANDQDGDISTDWQTATGEAADTDVVAGDLIVWNGTVWTYIPTGGTSGGPNFWQVAGDELSPVEDNYDISIGGGAHQLFANGSAFFSNNNIEFSDGGGVSIGSGSEISLFNGNGDFEGKLTSASTVDGDDGDTLVTKDYVDANVSENYWSRSGTTLSPATEGDNVELGGGISAANGYGTRLEDGQIIFRNDNGSATGCVRVLKGGDDTSTDVTAAINNDGSAEFTNSQSVKIRPTLADSSSGYALALFDEAGTDTQFSFGADGSAQFKGNVKNGSVNLSAINTEGHLLDKNGKLAIQRNDGSSENVLEVYAGTTVNVTVKADGQADFKGAVSSDTTGTYNFQASSSGNTYAGLYASDQTLKMGDLAKSQYRIQLNASDGSGKFSEVYAGARDISSNTAAGVDVNGTGSLYIQGNGTTGDGATIFQYSRGTDAANIKFTAGGSATFVGTHTAKVHFSVIPAAVSNPSNYSAFLVDYEGTQTAKITANGNASFNGKVTSASTTSGDSGTTLATKDYVDASGGGGGGITYNGAAAWGKFDYDGTLLNGLNVASITRDAEGFYTITFENPMPNRDYAVTLSTGHRDRITILRFIEDEATPESFRLENIQYNNGSQSDAVISFAVHATNALPPRGSTGTDAWASVESNGTIRSSFNISNVSRSETGRYQITFTNPMPSANYSINTSVMSAAPGTTYPANITTTGFLFCVDNAAGTGAQDLDFSFQVNATNAQLPDTVTQEQLDAVIAALPETGTFQPSFAPTDTGSGMQVTYDARVGEYTKIGNVVTFAIDISITSYNGGGTGILEVRNLPYQPKVPQGFAIGFNRDWDNTKRPMFAYNKPDFPNPRAIRLYYWDNASGTAEPLVPTDLKNTSVVVITGSYLTDD